MRVCFVALGAFPAFARTPGYVGGAQVQQAILAEYLVEQGVDVSCVCLDCGQRIGEQFNSIQCFPAYRARAGMPVVRFFHPRITGLWRAMAQADADVYYQRCAGMETGLVAAFCGRRRRRFVFATGSDADVLPGRQLYLNVRDRALFRYGLYRAHAVVVQHESQKALLEHHYGLSGIIIRSAYRLLATPGSGSPRRFILWVGTMGRVKRPELFVELARRMPHRQFVMAGGRSNCEPEVFTQVERAAKGLTNLRLTGAVPHSEILKYYQEAQALVTTSSIEGCPNTWLDAWATGTPVVSTYDAGGMLDREQLGLATRDVDGLMQAMHRLAEDYGLRQRICRAGVECLVTRHSVDVVGKQLLAVLQNRQSYSA